jgi:WD40 repeat protein
VTECNGDTLRAFVVDERKKTLPRLSLVPARRFQSTPTLPQQQQQSSQHQLPQQQQPPPPHHHQQQHQQQYAAEARQPQVDPASLAAQHGGMCSESLYEMSLPQGELGQHVTDPRIAKKSLPGSLPLASSTLRESGRNESPHEPPRKRRLVGDQSGFSESLKCVQELNEAVTADNSEEEDDDDGAEEEEEEEEEATGGTDEEGDPHEWMWSDSEGKVIQSEEHDFRHGDAFWRQRAACLLFCHENLISNFRTSAGNMDLPVAGRVLSGLPGQVVKAIGHAMFKSDLTHLPLAEALEALVELSYDDTHSRRRDVELIAKLSFPDGTQILASAARYEFGIRLWAVGTRRCVAILQGHDGHNVSCLTSYFDSDGVPSLASGSVDSTIILWDVVKRCQLARLGHPGSGWSIEALVTFSRSPSSSGRVCLASGGFDGDIILWDLQAQRAFATLHGHTGPVWCLCHFWNSAGQPFLASGGSMDKSIRVWALASREHIWAFEVGAAVKFLTCFTAVDWVTMLVSSDDTDTVKVWNVDSHSREASMKCPPALLSFGCAAGRDSRVLLVCRATGARGTRLNFFDLSTGERVLKEFSGSTCAVGVFIDGPVKWELPIWDCKLLPPANTNYGFSEKWLALSTEGLRYPQGLSTVTWEGEAFVVVCDAGNHMIKLLNARNGTLVRSGSVNSSSGESILDVVSWAFSLRHCCFLCGMFLTRKTSSAIVLIFVSTAVAVGCGDYEGYLRSHRGAPGCAVPVDGPPRHVVY